MSVGVNIVLVHQLFAPGKELVRHAKGPDAGGATDGLVKMNVDWGARDGVIPPYLSGARDVQRLHKSTSSHYNDDYDENNNEEEKTKEE